MREKKTRRWLSLLLTAVMLLSLIPGAALAAGTGTTNSQPFSSGTGGSANFRIPALITLSNGTLLAAADARYSGTGDGYGLDTIVSYSTDRGSSWNYSFPNFFDDSTGYNGSASAFIDPVLVQDKQGTVYLFADLYPGGGYYIANIKSGTGFTTVDGVSYLALYSSTSASSSTTPAYYVANELNSDGYYTVYHYSSKTASNYALDAEYDIYTVSNGKYTAVTGTQIDSSTTINANVFYTGTANQSGLYVLGTEYITMRKGTVNTDGSITWGGLELLNVKNSSEYFYGFGPGGGIVTSTGRIIVPLYTYANSADGKTSVIYSDDNGATWTRSADVNVQTSEASISEVTVGGTNYLYMFTRHGGYFVSSDNGATWSAQKSVSGISYTTSCELSTLTYSKLIDGCPAILLSAPTSNRTTGKIFVGLVQTGGSITWKYTYSVNTGTFQYSDLAELPDGSIGLLYENGSASIIYTNLAITTIASGAEIDSAATVTDNSSDVSVTASGLTSVTATKAATSTPADGYTASVTYSVTLNGGSYTGSAEIKIPYDSVFGGCTDFIGSVGSDTFAVTLQGGYFVGNAPHFSDVTISGRAATDTESVTKYVSVYVGQTYTDTIEGDYSNFDKTGLNESIATVSAEYKQVTGGTEEVKATSISSGSSYYIKNSSGQYLSSSATWVSDINSAALWTATSSGSGYTLKNGNNYLQYWNSRLSTTSSSSRATTWSFDSGTFSYSSWFNSYTLGDAYTVTTTDPVDATIVTIKGLTPGKTSVVVGNTTYNITVKEMPPLVNMETTPFVAGTGVGAPNADNDYTARAVTKLTTSVGQTFDLNLADGVATGGTWTVGDSGIATVDANGNVTGVSVGETTVTYTVNGVSYTIPVVIRQDATSSSVKVYDYYISEITNTTVYYVWNCTTELNEAQAGEAIYVSFNSNATTCCDFFGKPDEGYALTRMSSTGSDGAYFRLHTGDHKTIDTGSTGFYNGTIVLNGETKNGAGKNQQGLFGTTDGTDNLLVMLQAVIDAGCDGGMGWTRPSSNTSGVTSDLTFRSEKLPTVSKEVATVNGEAYTEGMVAHVGDKVVFNVTVTQYKAQNDISYSDVSLTDNLSGATFAGSTSSTKTITDLSNTAVSTDTTQTYQVEYTITDDDLDTTIVNTVDLTYTYQSAFSSGSFGGTANADAKITAVTFDPPDYVIDFGLPVKFDFSGEDDHGRYDLAQAEFVDEHVGGTVTVANNVVTFTPDARFLTCEYAVIRLTNTAGGTYTFKVTPASNVLYEDGFMTAASGTNPWTPGGSKTNDNSSATQSSENKAPYGYDAAYVSETGISGTAYTATVSSTQKSTAALSFTFSGTGFDLIGGCGPETGSIVVEVWQGSSLAKFYLVDTSHNGSYGTLHQVPLIHCTDLDDGTYTVNVKGGYLVYNTSSAASSTNSISTFSTRGSSSVSPISAIYSMLYDMGYTDDQIDCLELVGLDDLSTATYALSATSTVATTYALGNNTAYTAPESMTLEIDGFRVYRSTSNAAYVDGEKEATYVRALDTVDGTLNGAYLEYSTADTTVTSGTYEGLGGPQNEVYLPYNCSIAFKVAGTSSLQVSAKTVTGAATSWTVNGVAQTTLNTSTEMYYTVTPDASGLVTITNKSEGTLLAIANFKFTTAVSASAQFLALSDEDIATAVVYARMAYAPAEPDPEPEIPAFTPEISIQVKSTNVIRNKLVTVTITTSTDVAKLTINGKELWPTNSLLVKWGWSKTYTYVFVDTVKKTDTKTYEIIAYDAGGTASEVYTAQG